MQQFLVSTQVLADAFGVSDRRILQLVEAGVIEAAPGSGRARRFDLSQVVPQYAHFLLALAAGGPRAGSWAPADNAEGGADNDP